MSVLKITSENFESEVINSKEPVMIDFFANWCGPCKMMSPVIDEIAEELQNIKVGKINVDENQDLATKYNAMSIPTIVIIKDGKEIKRFVGVQDKENLIKDLK